MYNDQIQGVDLSFWNTPLSPEKLAAQENVRFVYAKSTQGLDRVDPKFKTHRATSIRAGKDFGGFHFLDWFNYTKGKEKEHGVKQAEFFWRNSEDNPGQLPPLLDTETNDAAANWGKIDVFNIGRVLEISYNFHVRLVELAGSWGGDYCKMWDTQFMKNFARGFYFGPRYKSVQAPVDMMVAGKLVKKGEWYQPIIDHFLSFAELQAYPKPTSGAFGKVMFHQYSSRLKAGLLGSDGFIDADIFNGTEAEYSALLGKTCVPTTPIENEDAPIPVTSTGKKVTVLSSVNVRNGIGTSASQLYVNGSPWVMLKGESADVLESAYDSRGNPWLRIGYKQWICGEYNGSKLAQLS